MKAAFLWNLECKGATETEVEFHIKKSRFTFDKDAGKLWGG